MNSSRYFKKFFFGVLITLVFIFSFNNIAEAQNGSLYFSPSSGTVSTGQSFSIVIRVNTGGTAINAAEGSIVFDPAKIIVSSISKSGSIFTFWAEEPKFSNAEGTIGFAGGVPSPGYSGSNGLLLTVTFKANTATTIRGSTEINLVSGGILANDGYGTNILSSLGKATYVTSPSTVVSTPIPISTSTAPKSSTPTPGELEVTVPASNQVNITSPTHPDGTKWYSNNNPLFKWDVPSGVSEVALVLSRRSNSAPFVNYSPPISEKLLDDLDEGEWYLNAQFKTVAGLGPVTSFKFNIDTQSPDNFDIVRLDTDDPTNPRPELLFKSSDAVSGIDRYEMKIGNNEWLKIDNSLAGQVYAIPLQKYGSYPVEVKAIDKAGNSTSAKLSVRIEPIRSPIIKEFTKEVKNGQPLIVKGTAEPGTKVVVGWVRNNAEFIEITPYAQAQGIVKIDDNHFTTTTTTTGDWFVAIDGLPSGKYKVFAVAQNDRLAISEPSDSVETIVRAGFIDFFLKLFDYIFKIFDRLVNVVSMSWLFIAFILVLIGLILTVIELVRIKAGKWLKQAGDFLVLKMIRRKSAKKVEHIIKDMQEELKFLNHIAKRRPLSTEEKYLKSRISSYVKMLRYIDEKVDDSK
ncbi:MAG: hypothetical protein A3B86_02575 [Candidatus Yanofskybacteria bacterium RIFCSPHIGHO2_02_FULL_38_22b]|uniref:Uncharacterized protein n=1 Tax=Candidatus Yanofskybacteria bacterium RIFCSPHIGHO2_02_FULL_38_22b TaxID=1802673 RepID=A0A1F8F3M8_9BACT|nr:MAG: hypothetical protein A2816_03280 [Candidatus Yanofskybacteria bacterium RIFCSPHIGHO2_01_FULL_39_44]OGN07741.1 MAG: hypothetical protein A3B86_02575 [Candidatus Yanofskybacteria bacterium RIFCSPHIGHO2_02_FULL_38_22b]OGN20623.1 MAG: hypothetical protein A2910_02410 [Candidatus Yanofskybacteria bacterium RIFCSPLOWO2_01_FULL_39_28]